MPTLEGVDYAWDRPNLDELWRQGKRFVSRYLAYKPNGKVLSRPELQALHAKGFGVCLNWEQATGDMLRGYSVGVTHATEALKQANELGAPSSIPIYFSCDRNIITQSEMNAVKAYLDGCSIVLGRSRVGVYGEFDVIEACVPNYATYGWQTYAWSGGRRSGWAHFLQYQNGVQLGGADVDLDRTLKDNPGFWYPNHRGDEELTPDEKNALRKGDAAFNDADSTLDTDVDGEPDTVFPNKAKKARLELEERVTVLESLPRYTIEEFSNALLAAIRGEQ